MSETFKNAMLSVILRYGAVTRESLFLIRGGKRYTERIIKSCIEDGLVEEHVRKDVVRVNYLAPTQSSKRKRIVDGKRQKRPTTEKDIHHYFRTLKYYTLTDAGVEYLIFKKQRSREETAAAEHLRKQFSRGGENIDRLLGISQSELLIWSITTFDEDVYKADKTQLKLFDGKGFANAKTIKYVAQNGSWTEDEQSLSRDYDRGRYNGCYFSPKMAIAVYNNFSPGFTWSKQAADPERRAIELFADTVKRENEIKGIMDISACIMINNPTHLKQIFFDLPGARRIPSETKSKAYRLGDPFSAMYAIPVNMTGTFHLYDILQDKCRETEITLLHYYWGQGYKSDTSMPGNAMIRIPTDNTEISYSVTLTLNFQKMYDIRDYMRDYPNKKVGVICRDWQIPYWKMLFGDDFPLMEAPKIKG